MKTTTLGGGFMAGLGFVAGIGGFRTFFLCAVLIAKERPGERGVSRLGCSMNRKDSSYTSGSGWEYTNYIKLL